MSEPRSPRKAARLDAKAKPKRKAAGGGGGGMGWFYVLLLVLAAGLAWVAWPYLSPAPTAAPRKPADRETQLREITSHPDAEVLNPEGDSSKKK